MKFCTESKKMGEAVKKKIRLLCDNRDYITWADVIEAFGHIPHPDTGEVGWPSDVVRKKMRLRETKNGWVLYFPDPEKLEDVSEDKSLNSKLQDHGLNIVMFEEDEFNEMISDIIRETIISICRNTVNMDRCKVISRPTKNSIREEFGYTLPIPFQLDFMKSNDERVAFPVFVVRMDDGSVRQVKPENIIFLDEE